VVFDEMVGYWFAVAFVPPGWAALGVGVVLFRLFDILKPPPVRWLDQNVGGGWGILLDDVAAGIYARCALAICQRLGAL
jgi:phosphatidylglycerophosphatase A